MVTAGKIDEALEELKCIAKYNGKKLSDESMKKLEMFKSISDKEIALVSAKNLTSVLALNNYCTISGRGHSKFIHYVSQIASV